MSSSNLRRPHRDGGGIDTTPLPLRHANTFHSHSASPATQATFHSTANNTTTTNGGSNRSASASIDANSMSLRAQHSILIGADILGEHVLEEGGSDDDDDFGAQIVTSRVALGQLQRNTPGSGRGGRGSGGLLGNHRSPADSTSRTSVTGGNPLSDRTDATSYHPFVHTRNGTNSSTSFVDFGGGDSILSGATPPGACAASASSVAGVDWRMGSTLTSQGNALAQNWIRCESPDHMGSSDFGAISCASPEPSRRQSLQPARHPTFKVPERHGSPSSPALSTSKLIDQMSPGSPYAARNNSIRPASITQITSTCTDDASDDDVSEDGSSDHSSSNNGCQKPARVAFPGPPTGASKLSPTAKLGGELMGTIMGGGGSNAEEDGDDDDKVLDEMLEEVERARETRKCNFSDFRLRMYPMNVLTPDYTTILAELTIAENRFESLPDEAFRGMTGVTRLDLSNNKLSTIPASILTLPALETLLCDHNQITHLPLDEAIASGFSILPAAKTIGLEWNELKRFPVQLIQECAKLEMLYVGENPNIFSTSLPSVSDLQSCHRAKVYTTGAPILKVKCVNRPRFVDVVENEGWSTSLPWITLDWNKIYPDRVLDFLFLGSLRTAQTPLVYEDLNIGFVLTAGRGLEVQIMEGMRHLELVVDDIPGAAADIEPLFDEAIAFIEEAKKAKKGILIHCFAGLSRSVTITVAYLMKTLYPMTRDDALALIRQSRPAAEPNRGFMETLLKYEKVLRRAHEKRHATKRASVSASGAAAITSSPSTPAGGKMPE